MKIGSYPRALKDYADDARLTKYELMALLALGDAMWLGIQELRHVMVVDSRMSTKCLKSLKEKGYIKVTRTENSFKKLCRKYSITQKGRDLIRGFINTLK
jgi:DNA-binding MarR family transcriptional regulator